MAKYRVKLPVTLYAGVIVLTKAQAAPRMHCLHSMAKNKFEIIEPIMFKVGEVIDIPGKPDKALAQRLSALVNGKVVDNEDEDDNGGDDESGEGSGGGSANAGENSELNLNGEDDDDSNEEGGSDDDQ